MQQRKSRVGVSVPILKVISYFYKMDSNTSKAQIRLSQSHAAYLRQSEEMLLESLRKLLED
jgi:hypothetical protein